MNILIVLFLLLCSLEDVRGGELGYIFYECKALANNSVQSRGCLSDELERQDRRLNLIYKELMAVLSKDRQKSLQLAQRAWIKYRDAKCEPSENGDKVDQIWDYPMCISMETARRADELDVIRRSVK